MRIARLALFPRMCLIVIAAFSLDHTPDLAGIVDAMVVAIFLIGDDGGLRWFPIHKPMNGFREDNTPMASENDVRLFGGNKQEVRTALGPAGFVIFIQLVQAYVGEVVWMPVTMEIHDHGRIQAQVPHYAFEERLPAQALRHRLHRIRQMPVRRECLITGKRRKAIGMRITKNVVKHAQASQATLELHQAGPQVWLRVSDSGRGFDRADISFIARDSYLKGHLAQDYGDMHQAENDPEAERAKKVETRLAFAILKSRIDSERSRGLSHKSDTNQKVEVVNQIENKRSTSHAALFASRTEIFQTF